MDSSGQWRSRSRGVADTVLTTVTAARAFLNTQPAVVHAATVHWLDQGSSRLAEQGSICQLQEMWFEACDEADQVVPSDPIEREAVRLYRVALAMAIVAKAEAPVRLH